MHAFKGKTQRCGGGRGIEDVEGGEQRRERVEVPRPHVGLPRGHITCGGGEVEGAGERGGEEEEEKGEERAQQEDEGEEEFKEKCMTMVSKGGSAGERKDGGR
jgi:hypothetical protein